MDDDVVSYDIKLHGGKWITDDNGREALLAYYDELPNKQFLIVPQPEAD